MDHADNALREFFHQGMHHFRAVHQLDIAVRNAHPVRDGIPYAQMHDQSGHAKFDDSVEKFCGLADDFFFFLGIKDEPGHLNPFDVVHIPDLVDEMRAGSSGSVLQNDVAAALNIDAPARVVNRTRQTEIRIHYHVGVQMLPFVQRLTKGRFHIAPVGVLHLAGQRTVHIHLVPRNLVNQQHGTLHAERVEFDPHPAFFCLHRQCGDVRIFFRQFAQNGHFILSEHKCHFLFFGWFHYIKSVCRMERPD